MSTWAEMLACIFPDLTAEKETALLELGTQAYIWWCASPFDTPQFGDAAGLTVR